MSKGKNRRGHNVRRELESAAGAQAIVRLSRSIRRSDTMEGFVVGLGQRWVLLAVLDPNMYLNGYAALRLKDVSKVKRRGGPNTFVGRVLTRRGHWPPVAVDVNLDSVGDLIASAAELGPLVTLHIEKEAPDVCFIGRPVRLTHRSVRLLEINPEAQWADQPTKWRFADLTRVEFGGKYEEALVLIGGHRP